MDNKFATLTIVSGQDLSANDMDHKVVTVGGTVATGAARNIGLLKRRTNVNQSSGQHVTVGYMGQMKARAGGAISTTSAYLAVANSGFIVAATSAQIAAGNVVGKALTAANSGSFFQGIFDFSRN